MQRLAITRARLQTGLAIRCEDEPLDFDTSSEFQSQHLVFKVSDLEFDAALLTAIFQPPRVPLCAFTGLRQRSAPDGSTKGSMRPSATARASASGNLS